jgi:hypothetical protein
MVRIIFEQREYNFDGIINGIREYTWFKAKSFKKEESRKKLLHLTYRTLQALWTHGQKETDNGNAMAKFIRCEAKSVATVTTFKWAVDKTFSMTETLALSLGSLKDVAHHDQDGSTLDSTEEVANGPKVKKEVRFHHDHTQEQGNAKLAAAMDNLSATLVNERANRESLVTDDSWAYKAVKLASSITTTEPATTLAKGISAIIKQNEKNARDSIAHDLNLRRHANFRIDKTMATHIRGCQVFRMSQEVTGHMSIFHCFPRDPFEFQDIISGEELETRVRIKVINSKVVEAQYETKMGIALTAEDLRLQIYNFWQYNCFMFGDDSWLAKKIKEIHEVVTIFGSQIKGIATNDKDYILLLAAKLNNEYHLFLYSCVVADGDINSVAWEHLENFPNEIKNKILTRERPNFIISTMIRAIADQSKREYKRKQELENFFEPTGLTPPRKQRPQELNKYRKREESDDDTEEREVDPKRQNPNVNKKWKLSVKEFRRIITPNVSTCPTLNNKSICARYNITGRCVHGSQCHHSHDALTGDAKEEFDKWFKSCKELAKQNNDGKNKKKKDD